MSKVRQITADSIEHLLSLLGLRSCEPFQREFRAFLNEEAGASMEDWSTEPELLEVLYCYIRQKRPHTILEIGTYKGLASIAFAHALSLNEYGHLYTVDNNDSGVVEQAKRRFSLNNRSALITLIEKSSQEAFVDWGRARIDFLFIDGAHDFLNSCSDIALWSRYVRSTGLIAIHDTVTRLLRHFPDDYIFPLCYYDILHVVDMRSSPSGQEWEGCGFLKVTHTFREEKHGNGDLPDPELEFGAKSVSN